VESQFGLSHLPSWQSIAGLLPQQRISSNWGLILAQLSPLGEIEANPPNGCSWCPSCSRLVELSAQLAETATAASTKRANSGKRESAKATNLAHWHCRQRDQSTVLGHRFDVTAGASLGAGNYFLSVLGWYPAALNAFDI